MTDAIELSAPVRSLLGAARCAVRLDAGVLTIGESELEVRYELRDVDGLRRLDRVDRGDPALLEIEAPALDDVFRYLLVELGPVARRFHGLQPAVFPTFAPEVGAGFTRDVRDDGVVVVRGGRMRARFRSEDPFGVSRSTDFTHYADLPLERISELILTTTVSVE